MHSRRHRQPRQHVIDKLTQPNHIQLRITPPPELDAALARCDNEVAITCPIYELEVMQDMRSRLNKAKSQLDEYYIRSTNDPRFGRRWFQFQSAVDLYRPLRDAIARRFNAKHVTNAWLKYWEIYNHYHVIPHELDHQYIAFFNAELPGAALCAFNHYMKTMRPDMPFNWWASSLMPSDDTTALGDKYGLYSHNRAKWLMSAPSSGHPNNGDATNPDNLRDFAARIGPIDCGSKDLVASRRASGASSKSPETSLTCRRAGVDLYSHDAGIDVSDDFNAQETSNARIHLGCALAGFLTLRRGGVFIAKQYTFFETLTWNLILVYASLFREFYICKPLTSRPYNSEIYLIGKDFLGISDAVAALLINKLTRFDMDPIIPEDFVRETACWRDFDHAAHVIFDQQIAFLDEHVKLFRQYEHALSQLQHGLVSIKLELEGVWLTQYPIKPIKDSDQIPSN